MENFFSLFTAFKDLWTAGQNNWGHLHPLVVHFPFAILFLTPFFIACGLYFTQQRTLLFRSALALMASGTFFIILSTATGELAAEKISSSPAIIKTLELHLNLAEQSRLIFAILTVLFALYVFNLASINKKLKASHQNIVIFSFIFVFSYALLILGNAAHQGGKLVHEHGIKSQLYLHTVK